MPPDTMLAASALARTAGRGDATPPRSGIEYAGLALAALFLLVMVGLPLVVGLRNAWRAVASTGWPTTEGVVVDAAAVASLARDRGSDGRVRETQMTSGQVTVHYRIGGATHVTRTLHFGEWAASGSATWAQLRLLRHPVGARVRVSYHPRDPGLAVVHPGLGAEALVLPGIGLGLLTSLLLARHIAARGGSLLWLFAAMFATAGVALLGVGGLRLWRAHASARWPTVPAVIVYGPGAESYFAGRDAVPLVYRYVVAGHTYFSDVRAFGQIAATNEEGWAERIAQRYPAGAPVTVRHAPDRPELAVLEPGIAREAWLLPGAGALLLLFGLAAAGATGGTGGTATEAGASTAAAAVAGG